MAIDEDARWLARNKRTKKIFLKFFFPKFFFVLFLPKSFMNKNRHSIGELPGGSKAQLRSHKVAKALRESDKFYRLN